MPSYMVGQINIKDDELWNKYIDDIETSLESYDAKMIFNGDKEQLIAGTKKSSLVVKFFKCDELNTWFNSEKYQSTLVLRDEAANVSITTYKEY